MSAFDPKRTGHRHSILGILSVRSAALQLREQMCADVNLSGCSRVRPLCCFRSAVIESISPRQPQHRRPAERSKSERKNSFGSSGTTRVCPRPKPFLRCPRRDGRFCQSPSAHGGIQRSKCRCGRCRWLSGGGCGQGLADTDRNSLGRR